jgi:hypothetical protein
LDNNANKQARKTVDLTRKVIDSKHKLGANTNGEMVQ